MSKKELPKAVTGIQGFDEITGGGVPRGRPTLIVGGPGSGKTLFAMEFLVRGARDFGEPGVFISFEEAEKDLKENVASLGFDIDDLKRKKMLAVEHVKVNSGEIIETGEYDLEGLFIRLNHAIDTVKAKRVVLDTIEAIFATFTHTNTLRSEISRLFSFLKDKGVTAIVTGEKGGEGSLSRNGLEEYVSDMVVVLDNRVINEMATRRLRIIKYRGSAHGSNEYPFLIEDNGISVLPVTSVGLRAAAKTSRISSGIKDLDDMMGGKGFYEGSTVLVTGDAGTGKTSMAVVFAKAACERGKKVLYYTFEESPSQITRNMRSIGINLEPLVKKGLLTIRSDRPTSYGLETHLAKIHKLVREVYPDVAIFDPISSLANIGSEMEIKSAILRITDFLKMRGTSVMFTDLRHVDDGQMSIISSIVDTWILLQDSESNGEKNRLLRLVKSRGMAHSNQIREFHITGNGIRLIPPYTGPEGMLVGSARFVQEAKERDEETARLEEVGRLRSNLAQEKRATQLKIVALRNELARKEMELAKMVREGERRHQAISKERNHIRQLRTRSGGV